MGDDEPNPGKKNWTLQLDPETIVSLDVRAKAEHLPTRTMVRKWILDRLESEEDVWNPASGKEFHELTPPDWVPPELIRDWDAANPDDRKAMKEELEARTRLVQAWDAASPAQRQALVKEFEYASKEEAE